MKRGRPACEGILTPREWEVLALVREGLTNEQIGIRLGITERGARYHVSEIIAKLGVESRKEAAAWKEERRRFWSLDLSWLLAGRLLSFPSLLPTKLILVPITMVAVAVGLSFAGLSLAHSGRSDVFARAPESADVCDGAPCQSVDRIMTNLESYEAAATVASFEPAVPPYLPQGFEMHSLLYARIDFPADFEGLYDMLFATYRNESKQSLVIQQGWYSVAPTGFYRLAPTEMKGTVLIEDTAVHWMRGGPKAATFQSGHLSSEGWNDGSIVIFWSDGRRAIEASEHTPYQKTTDGLGSEFAYAISSETLPVEELLKVAESMIHEE